MKPEEILPGEKNYPVPEILSRGTPLEACHDVEGGTRRRAPTSIRTPPEKPPSQPRYNIINGQAFRRHKYHVGGTSLRHSMLQHVKVRGKHVIRKETTAL